MAIEQQQLKQLACFAEIVKMKRTRRKTGYLAGVAPMVGLPEAELLLSVSRSGLLLLEVLIEANPCWAGPFFVEPCTMNADYDKQRG